MFSRREAQVFFDSLTASSTFLALFGAGFLVPVAIVSFLGSVAAHTGANGDEEDQAFQPPPTIDEQWEANLYHRHGEMAVTRYRHHRTNGFDPIQGAEEAVYDVLKAKEKRRCLPSKDE